MPEGDSVFRVANWLNRALAGKKLVSAQIRTSDFADATLAGRTVRGAHPEGKHLFIRIGDWSLHSHMRMDGVWHIYPKGAKWRRPGFQARIVLTTEQHQVVGFNVAEIALLPTREEHQITRKLGPDPLKPDWGEHGLEEAQLRVGADPRAIHVALQDQWNVAGFGNEYANEICFLGGVHPATPATEVDARGLLMLGARLIWANRNRTPRTTTGNTRAGKRLHVYGRAGRPCARCGTVIRFTRLGATRGTLRHVYWCPHCQPRGTDQQPGAPGQQLEDPEEQLEDPEQQPDDPGLPRRSRSNRLDEG